MSQDESEADEAPTLRLDQFLKLAGIADTGGQAKLLIQAGEVLVNGQVETRRRRKVSVSDVIGFDGGAFRVSSFLVDD